MVSQEVMAKEGTDTIEGIVEPLLTLPIAAFHIQLEAEKTWRPYGAEGSFRGRLGWRLREICCPHRQTSKDHCVRCEIRGDCVFPDLFMPAIEVPKTLADGTVGRRWRSLPAPFVFAFDTPRPGQPLRAGEPARLIVKLFGPAIRHVDVFMESAVFALTSYPLRVRRIDPIGPAPSADPLELAYSLSDWIVPLDHVSRDRVTMGFVTPVRLTRDEALVTADVEFSMVVRAVIRRLRDLKRAYHDDGEMGRIGPAFYARADAVRVADNRLSWCRRKRSFQGRKPDVFLNGLEGDITFSGGVSPFLALLLAAQLIHLGKGTSCGNGRVIIRDPSMTIDV
jgi:hypothetical protein